ncbi:ATP-binding protein [Alicyclobacillus sp. SO9]|uniref:ATP-binding protein n=1 Tax=Alicyclobacillus sp. SO9 TaxID=2665646 RepID=UPI0018E8FA8D|nr:ATP-binding protein [Alicyclobacillus sp. SO9]QQE77604.1 response regulator [Alicyclobacillus sp. SO9]
MKKIQTLVRDRFLHVLALLFIVFGFMFYVNHQPRHVMPVARKGVMDASTWNFSKKGVLLLQGQWAYYPSHLLNPSEIGSRKVQSSFVQIPAQNSNGQVLRGNNSWGYETYHLTIHVNSKDTQMGLLIRNIESSRKIYVNGSLVLQSGIPAVSPALYTPGDKPQVVYFHPHHREINIVIQTANFDFYRTGIVSPIVLGTSQQIQRLTFFNNGMDFAASSIIGLFGVYYLSLFLILWKQRYKRYYDLLLMGAFFLIFSVEVPFEGAQIIFKVFPLMPYETYWKLKIVLPVLVVLLILQYILYVLHPSKYRHVFTAFEMVFLGYGFATMALPMRMIAKGVFIHSLMGFGSLINAVIFITLLVAYVRERYGRFEKNEIQLYMLASLSLVVIVVNNALYVDAVLNNNLITNLTRLFLVGLISGLLVVRYYHAFSRMESLTEKLRESDRLKDSFLVQTAHELKTPLHVIINIIQSLVEKMNAGSRTEGFHTQQLQLVQVTARRMSGTVNDIMDLARIREGRLQVNFSDVDIRSCFALTTDLFSYLIKEQKLKLTHKIYPGAELVRADESRLLQVLFNMVQNSIKHTEEGFILLTAKRQDGHVCISVEDTGTGISEDRQSTLFTPYESSEEGKNTHDSGIGLGLVIARELIRIMGGELYLDWTETNKGSRFVFELPAVGRESYIENVEGAATMTVQKSQTQRLTTAAEVSAASSPDDEEVRGRPTILAVDDEFVNLRVLSSLFEGDDYYVRSVQSGRAALASIERQKPDLILLDVTLPDISGYEVCRLIRQTHSLIELPVLFLTVRNTPEDIEYALSMGGNDFIAKPFEAKEIRARVTTLLTMKELSQAVVRNEIAFLQAQIKPHFLYNALNTISALCESDPLKAEHVTDELSLYLRSRFDFSNLDKLVPLRQELEYIYAYINIETARFGERLQVTYDVASGLDVWIPPLILQPLVENAVKHGLRSRREGCQVKITVTGEASATIMEVVDNGVGMSQVKVDEILRDGKGGGVGLKNVDQRLKKLFGRGLSITSAPGEGTRVVVMLPRRLHR